jgi:hypothetical protein
MANSSRDRDPLDRTGLPRWVKVAGIAVAVVVLLAVVMMMAGGGSGHNPPSHGYGGDTDTTPFASGPTSTGGHR